MNRKCPEAIVSGWGGAIVIIWKSELLIWNSELLIWTSLCVLAFGHLEFWRRSDIGGGLSIWRLALYSNTLR